MNRKAVYRVIFHHQGDVYELYAGDVQQGAMFAFVEVADIIFGERSELLVDPAEEKLKSQFAGVKRTFIPIQAVIRIDEVEKEGPNRVYDGGDAGSTVTPFPLPITPPSGKSK